MQFPNTGGGRVSHTKTVILFKEPLYTLSFVEGRVQEYLYKIPITLDILLMTLYTCLSQYRNSLKTTPKYFADLSIFIGDVSRRRGSRRRQLELFLLKATALVLLTVISKPS